MKKIQIIKMVIRLLLGTFLITTAILKLITIEPFELYIYSFNIMSFVLAALAARVIIAFEFLLGAFLIIKIFYKPVWYATMTMLIGFTFFLIYAAIFRNDSNCHCMGDIILMKPLPSIVKNLISITLLVLIKNQTENKFKFKKIVVGLLVAIAIVVPFFVFPMDVLYNKIRAPKDLINEKAFAFYKQDSTFRTAFNVDSGCYLIGFVTSKCPYCKTGNAKLHQLATCNQIDKTKIKFIILGDSVSVKQFQNDTETGDYQYITINKPYLFLNITNGSFPKYIYIENGEITKAINAQGFNEPELKMRLK